MSNQEEYDSKFLLRLFLIFNKFGRWKQAVDLISDFIPKAEAVKNWVDAVQLRIQQARYLLMSGKITTAEDALNFMPSILEKIPEQAIRQRLEILFFNALGTVFKKQGNLTKAEKMIRKSWDLAKTLDYIQSHSVVPNSLENVLFGKHWDIAENVYDIKYQSIILNSLGGVLQRQGKLGEAEQIFRECLGIVENLDDQKQKSIVLNSLGGVLKRQGKLGETEQIFRECLGIVENLDDQKQKSIVLNSLGGVLKRQGKLEEAEQIFREALGIVENLDDQKQKSIVLNSLGGV